MVTTPARLRDDLVYVVALVEKSDRLRQRVPLLSGRRVPVRGVRFRERPTVPESLQEVRIADVGSPE